MKVFRSLEAVPLLPRGSVLAIGNFDGLHLGHLKILATLAAKAKSRSLNSCVLTFSPHPEKFFSPEKVLMIQTLDQRLEGIARSGIDLTLIIPFDRKFAALPTRDFIRRVVRRTLQARLVIIGRDFRFGKGRRGDVTALAVLGREFGFATSPVPPVRRRGHIVSSSLIRELLDRGRMGRVKEFLGRPYSVEGDIVGGDARGRHLGFPTANIASPNEILPRGVFLTLIDVGGVLRPSLTNIGIRPTFDGKRLSMETHILGFQRNIYGTSVKVHFLKKLRDERIFAGASELAVQLRRDREAALLFFGRRRRAS